MLKFTSNIKHDKGLLNLKEFFCIWFLLIITFKAESAACITSKSTRKKSESNSNYSDERESCVQCFDTWSETEQVDFVEHLISRMCHYQHGQINTYLKPMLQRDFISALPGRWRLFFKFLFSNVCLCVTGHMIGSRKNNICFLWNILQF